MQMSSMCLCLCQADEMVYRWLSSVHLERYYRLFTDAGYDLPTISRMTPEVDSTFPSIAGPQSTEKHCRAPAHDAATIQDFRFSAGASGFGLLAIQTRVLPYQERPQDFG